MEIYGKLHEKGERIELVRKDGEAVKDHFGRAMEKMTFVIRLQGKKDKYAMFETLDSRVMSFLGDTSIGTELCVKFNYESSKWNDRWFNKALAYECEVWKQEEDELRFTKNNSKEAMADMMRTDRKNGFFDDKGNINKEYDDQLPF